MNMARDVTFKSQLCSLWCLKYFLRNQFSYWEEDSLIFHDDVKARSLYNEVPSGSASQFFKITLANISIEVFLV